MNIPAWIFNERLPAERFAIIAAAVAPSKLEPIALLSAVDGALHSFEIARDKQAAERAADKRKLAQVSAAAAKLKALIRDKGAIAALDAGRSRASSPTDFLIDGELDGYRQTGPVLMALDEALKDAAAILDEAINAPAPADIRRDDALNGLIVELARIFTTATSEVVTLTYDPASAGVGGRFMTFLRASTIDALGTTPPSDEAFRARIRELQGLGDIPQKYVGRRLYPMPDDAATEHVTRNDEVTDDHESPQRNS